MNKTFGILFLLKKSKKDAMGKSPIYLRITVEGKRVEISVKRSILASKWSSKAQRSIGRSSDAKELNSYLDSLLASVYRHHRELIQDDVEVTASVLKNRILGVEAKQRMLVKLFEEHNNRAEELKGVKFASGTIDRYKTTKKHIESFLKDNYGLVDINLVKIDYQFIIDFEHYLKTVRKCAHNTTLKYIRNFKKIIRLAMAKGWVKVDPFMNFKVKLDAVKREYLTEEELNTIYTKDLHGERLSQVRDMFIFCCYTGLAYTDVRKLTPDHIVTGIDGGKWINVYRTKTENLCKIPLLPIAEEIILKYKNNKEVLLKSVLLPVLSNQKSNSYLKEVAGICKINKNLTTHIGRHTFATTVTLTNGVPLESVSNMLGHSSIKSTQHYAKVTNRKVSNDMQQLKEVMEAKKDLPIKLKVSS
ncbi:site-specific integrase [Polaribacter undariae]|uniref:Site-specific integrase n=1 Tax=Polaribacter sejongensis TaxID=985043 RepID=A0AAJ1QZG0_9FLAO|nr:site-specific integrase [Polaribacter undariae]MDN3620763.1 site-specific integrase [Polaribacter undariae]UWD31363.1 site-specific integrase [Polaribacter undariae]